jgi:hypothetical protein
MNFKKMFVELAGRCFKKTQTRRRIAGLSTTAIESLEERVVLYALSGDEWPSPKLITISFVPDGTNIGGTPSNMFAAFNGNTDLVGRWQDQILKAAQTWAQNTNINFVLVSDSGILEGGGDYQQGAPTYGDIRISGVPLGTVSAPLAAAFMPNPDNNSSLAGDFYFNTSDVFGVGTNYDLFTVAAHEIGHTLGLDHTAYGPNAEMWSTYNGTKLTYSSDDIAGIRAIYSSGAARSVDQFDAGAGNNTFATAADITNDAVRLKKWIIEDGLDITTNSDVDYYKVVIPIGAVSKGLSLMAPKLTVYAANQTTILGSADGTGQYGATLSVPINGVVQDQVLYIKVEGATATPFGIGAYGLTVDLGGTKTPAVTLPNTLLKNGNPIVAGGGQADSVEDFGTSETDPNAPTIAVESVTRKAAVVSGTTAAGSLVTVYLDGLAVGTSTADNSGKWSFTLAGKLSAGMHRFTATATDSDGLTTGQSKAAIGTGIVARRNRK